MSDAYRPSWLPPPDDAGRPGLHYHRGVASLLLMFGVGAGVAGGGVGATMDDGSALTGVVLGLLWAAPYLLSAFFCFVGADRFWLTVALCLGLWGVWAAGGALYVLPGLGNLGGGASEPMGGLWWILAALVAGNGAIVLTIGRPGGLVSRGRQGALLYAIFVLLPLWYLWAFVVVAR